MIYLPTYLSFVYTEYIPVKRPLSSNVFPTEKDEI